MVAIAVPFKLEDGAPEAPPSYLAAPATSAPAIVLATTYSQTTPAAIAALAWALEKEFTVNIDVQSGLHEESGWEAFEEFLTKATAASGIKGKIVLCECFSRTLCGVAGGFKYHVCDGDATGRHDGYCIHPDDSEVA